jgi:GSH-dependent disulfide-bond oxidoreductase
LNRRLEVSRFIAVDMYTIADMAIFPWVTVWKKQKQELSAFPNLLRWEEEVRLRPATIRAYQHASGSSGRKLRSSTKT